MRQTLVEPADPAAIERAATLILAGECVAVPTETVYGLAADATSDRGVAAVYAAKGRPTFNPLIVHVRDLRQARSLGHFTDEGLALARQYWPGPLTLVVRSRGGNGIVKEVTAGLATIALRVPAHPVMQALLMATGRPLAAPSANASGRISPTRAAHALETLNGKIPMIIDGGASSVGLESTIIHAVGDLQVLRAGTLDLSLPLHSGTTVLAPGQLSSHYSPNKKMRLNAAERRVGEWLIGFGALVGDASLSEDGNMIEASARLYEALHHADASAAESIAVAVIPETGAGIAINDRLRRAASR